MELRNADTAVSTDGEGESTAPYTGIDDRRILQLARVMSYESSTFGEFQNPFGSDIADSRLDPNSPDFSTREWCRNMHRLFRTQPDKFPAKNLAVSFRNLSAHGYGSDAQFQLNVLNAAQYIGYFLRELMGNSDKHKVDILHPMDGVVKPGEMLVVLGRPGSGCSTFLRTMAAQVYGFKLGEDTKLNYMGLPADKIASQFRGDVTYCAESELHFPQMTVGDTLMFAVRLKTPPHLMPGVSRIQYAEHMRDMIMATFGLSHTMNTRIGNDLIRGVSGGERKRVSIAELALCGSSLQCWDNSTRGLDAATALEFIHSVRTAADIFKVTSMIAVYQASEEMYNEFDKAVVLYEGYQIYFGPAGKARQFFYDMGWEPKPRQPTPDFLTSLSQPSEREPRPGFEDKVPRTAYEFNQRWLQSDLYKELMAEIDEFDRENPLEGPSSKRYEVAHQAGKDKSLPPRAAYTVGWRSQIHALTIRGWQRMKGDPTMPLTTVLGDFILGMIIASMFYNLPVTTGSFYYRTALLFYALLFNAMSSLLEIFALYQARPIVEKHHQYALYHPAIDAIASIITELPVKLCVSISFNLPIYFLTNLRREPGNFFFYLLVGFASTLCMSHVFRTIGALTVSFEQAMIPAHVVLLALIFFTGFVIPVVNMHGWCRWINYLDPLSYAYEALVANEFHNVEFPCSTYLPQGPTYVPGTPGTVCSVAGSTPGLTTVLGDVWIWTSYRYKWSHAWRNFGLVCAFGCFSLLTYMLAVWVNPGARTKGEILIFPHKVLKKLLKSRGATNDAESGSQNSYEKPGAAVSNDESHTEDQLIESSSDIFYWKDLCYDIKIKGGTRRLLNYIDGWVKPGTLTALMGASGAGKTTLLDVLANRVTMGVVTGSIFVNGAPRGNSFQRSTGYAMQQDIHLSTATVRESLTFSAILRQPFHHPTEEKLQYVENVIKILDMEPYADAVVGVPGEGLNVEQRKRLTIGVELAAKPKLLLFLDEPTSGLDSQTAWSICQLLKKLSNAGQAILCTIHQPSALLLQQFDRLLFLASGGRPVYFGEIGENARTLTSYFERNGADKCPDDANPAEWMLHVIGAAPGSHANANFADVWLHSPERQAIRQEIKQLMESYGASADNVDDVNPELNSEFAAPLWFQYVVTSIRTLQQHYRSPSYIWSKIFLTVIGSIFNGFVFYKADNTLQGMQNMMFSIFMFTTIMSTIIQQMLPSFVQQRSQYEARERPSKMFRWQVFLCSQITAEIPWQSLCAVLGYVTWYFPAGLYRNAQYENQFVERTGLVFFLIWLFYIYSTSLGHLTIAGMDDADSASNVAMMLFLLCLMFCGILVRKDDMPGFWKFMYRCSPMTYWVGSILPAGIANAPVTCADYEFVDVYPPNNETCISYMAGYLNVAGGYLQNDLATDVCRICSLSKTNTFLESVNMPYMYRWRNLLIFMCYIFINFAGCIFIYWLVRVPKSSDRVKSDSSHTDPNKDYALEEANATKPSK